MLRLWIGDEVCSLGSCCFELHRGLASLFQQGCNQLGRHGWLRTDRVAFLIGLQPSPMLGAKCFESAFFGELRCKEAVEAPVKGTVQHSRYLRRVGIAHPLWNHDCFTASVKCVCHAHPEEHMATTDLILPRLQERMLKNCLHLLQFREPVIDLGLSQATRLLPGTRVFAISWCCHTRRGRGCQSWLRGFQGDACMMGFGEHGVLWGERSFDWLRSFLLQKQQKRDQDSKRQ